MSSTLLEDRRAAVMGLKGLAKDYNLDVGTKGMPALVKVLKNDQMDSEIVKASIEALQILCSSDKDNLGTMFCEIYAKDPSNVEILLDLLKDTEFYIRFDIVQLLSTLLKNNENPFKEAVLSSPIGLSRICELIEDKREIIRNESLLLLIQLTRNNSEIQKIVAFDNAFDKLFRIIFEENGTEGGIIVSDCFQLMINLLQSNPSNQNLFRESGCISQLKHLYLNGTLMETNWSDSQKASNASHMIELVRCLVASPNATLNQNALNAAEIVPVISSLAMTNIPIRELAMTTFGDLIKSNNDIQLSRIYIPSMSPSKSADSIEFEELLRICEEKNENSLKRAAFYCFLCENQQAQIALANLVRHAVTQDDATIDPLSQLLLNGLFDMEDARRDPLKMWFSVVLLCHLVKDNENSRILLFESKVLIDQEEISLIDKCCYSLLSSQDMDPMVSIALLQFLCMFLYEFTEGVAVFLSDASHVQFLLEQIIQSQNEFIAGLSAFLLAICYEFNDEKSSYNRSAIQSIAKNRIGADVFVGKIEKIRDSKSLLAVYPQEPNPLFDVLFCEFFKSTCDHLSKAPFKKSTHQTAVTQKLEKASLELADLKKKYNELMVEHEDLLLLLADQDEKLQEYKQRLVSLGQQVSDDELD